MSSLIEPLAYICKCEHPGYQHDPLTGKCRVMIQSLTTPLVFPCPCQRFEMIDTWTGQQSEGRIKQ